MAEERHHVTELGEPLKRRPLERPRVAELSILRVTRVKTWGGDVELEVVVSNLPGRVENECGDGDASLPELGHCVDDLAPVAPDV